MRHHLKISALKVYSVKPTPYVLRSVRLPMQLTGIKQLKFVGPCARCSAQILTFNPPSYSIGNSKA